MRLKRVAATLLSAALLSPATSAQFPASSPPADCRNVDQQNPLSSIYPDKITGLLNGTVALLPIPLSLARSIIPPQWKILEDGYRELLPDFPQDMYPAILQALVDHDIRFGDFQGGDFSKTAVEFPFLELLEGTSAPYRWSPSYLISSSSAMAIAGASEYGTIVHPSSFTPSCNAYSADPSSLDTTIFSASADNSHTTISTSFSSALHAFSQGFVSQYSSDTLLSFFVNSTNQPSFGNGTKCDHYTRLFNTPVTTAAGFEPQRVMGKVAAMNLHPFTNDMTWDHAVGFRLATAFTEIHLSECADLVSVDGQRAQQEHAAKVRGLEEGQVPEHTNVEDMNTLKQQREGHFSQAGSNNGGSIVETIHTPSCDHAGAARGMDTNESWYRPVFSVQALLAGYLVSPMGNMNG